VNPELCGLLPACRQCHIGRKLFVLTSIVVFNTIFVWSTHEIMCPPYGTSECQVAWRCTIGCRSCFDYCLLTTEVEVYRCSKTMFNSCHGNMGTYQVGWILRTAACMCILAPFKEFIGDATGWT